jgi:hypothetical protein
MEETLYCIASLASNSVLQLLTTAAGLPFAAMGAIAAVAGAAAPADVEVVAGAAVMGAIGAVAVGDGLVPAGAGPFGDELLPQAESTSVQATASAGIFRFIIQSPWPNQGLSGRNASRHVKVGAMSRHGSITRRRKLHERALTAIPPARG